MFALGASRREPDFPRAGEADRRAVGSAAWHSRRLEWAGTLAARQTHGARQRSSALLVPELVPAVIFLLERQKLGSADFAGRGACYAVFTPEVGTSGALLGPPRQVDLEV